VVEVLSRDKYNAPLAAGEFITTGTVTRAFPIAAGEVWSTEFYGAPFQGLTMRIT
jgi:2-oxo-3-hexenedioate decarboxylase